MSRVGPTSRLGLEGLVGAEDSSPRPPLPLPPPPHELPGVAACHGIQESCSYLTPLPQRAQNPR